ncbi:MAG: glycoside hydrolase family 127 protein, partial [Planctomycetaceae bacterium]|nr:glycoside hydrolase family 127 protein [Planctomycetaceae bacterium]
FFGPGNPEAEKGMDLWPNMIVLFIMQSYYEHCGQKGNTAEQARIIEFMTKYFKFVQTYPEQKFLKTYWENSRGGDLLFSCFWLYNHTGDKFLLEVAEKIHRNTANWMQQSSLPNWHNVNIAQSFREPATWWMYSKQDRHKQATYNNFWLVRACFGQVPGGMFGADENARMGYIDPRQGTETCGFVEQMSSDVFLVRITGDPSWADHCEDVAFNSYPASFMPDFKALRYITSPNQVLSDSKNHRPGIDNGGPFMMMNPFSSRCCQHNHTQGWPYYAEHLWMATPDNGLAAILYNACTVKAKVGDGTEVTIKEETHYPFEEQTRLTIKTSKEVAFPLYLRVPKWCEKMTICINNKPVEAEITPQKYVKIDRQWKEGDTVTVDLPMVPTYRTWQQNKGCVSIDYGPLTFSLKIKERYEKMGSRETALHDSGWQEGADESQWPSFEIHPDSDWNYGIASQAINGVAIVRKPWTADNYPWTPDSVPLLIKTMGKKIPDWQIDQYGLCSPVPQSPVRTAEPLEEIELIPMGAARLRISAFPVVE